jgi:hypothetical protein
VVFPAQAERVHSGGAEVTMASLEGITVDVSTVPDVKALIRERDALLAALKALLAEYEDPDRGWEGGRSARSLIARIEKPQQEPPIGPLLCEICHLSAVGIDTWNHQASESAPIRRFHLACQPYGVLP